MNEEERHHFDAQATAIEHTSRQQLLLLAQRRVEEQALPIGQPNTIPRRRFIQKKTHGRADARALTALELPKRRLSEDTKVLTIKA